MELEAQVDEDFARTDDGKPGAGLKHWVIFAVMMMKWPLSLFPEVKVPTLQETLGAEKKLLLFGRWLSKDYASSTTVQYIGEVRKAHISWLGVPLASMSVTFHRLPMLFRMLKREKPGNKRVKTPWEYENFGKVRRAYGVAADKGYYGAGETGFRLATVATCMYLAYEHLLRLNEVVRTQTGTAADKDPLQWDDVQFWDASGELLGWDTEGRPLGLPSLMTMRMPPSKTDQLGLRQEVLRSPFPKGWENGAALNAAGPAMWRYMRQYPVRRERAGYTPLFRQERTECSARLTKAVFMTAFHKLCRKAGIQYSAYGTHCFRVGGVNRLMDLGATAPQICALGRWQSDCWQLYARRERVRLEGLTAAMSATP
jgi:hypothetical protein